MARREFLPLCRLTALLPSQLMLFSSLFFFPSGDHGLVWDGRALPRAPKTHFGSAPTEMSETFLQGAFSFDCSNWGVFLVVRLNYRFVGAGEGGGVRGIGLLVVVCDGRPTQRRLAKCLAKNS